MQPSAFVCLAVCVCIASCADDLDIRKIEQAHPPSRTLFQLFSVLVNGLSLGTIPKLVTCPDQFACVLRRDGQTIGLLNESQSYINNGLQVRGRVALPSPPPRLQICCACCEHVVIDATAGPRPHYNRRSSTRSWFSCLSLKTWIYSRIWKRSRTTARSPSRRRSAWHTESRASMH